MTRISDETLMALADGELDGEQAEHVRRAIAQDEALAMRFAEFVETRMLLAASPSPGGDIVPERLRCAAQRLGEALHDRHHAPFRGTAGAAERPAQFGVDALSHDIPPPIARNDNASAMPRSIGRNWRIAMAASLAVLIGGIGGLVGQLLMTWGPFKLPSEAPFFGAVSPAIAHQLSLLASGQSASIELSRSRTTIEITIVATHRMERGGICREFAVKPQASDATRQIRVACRDGNAWETRLVVITPVGAGFSPAQANETADQFLEAAGSSGVLTGEAERKALAP